MSRSRQYATPAARQAAYRQRMKETTLLVNREPFLRMDQAMETLYQALHHAAIHKHHLAQTLLRATPVETLEAVVAWVTIQLQTADSVEEREKM